MGPGVPTLNRGKGTHLRAKGTYYLPHPSDAVGN